MAMIEQTYDAVAPNDLTAINNRIHATNDMITKTIESLDTTADRVFGAYPRPAENTAKPIPVTNGMLEDINSLLDRLQTNTQRLVESASRFHRL